MAQEAPLLFVRLLDERGNAVRVASDEIETFEYVDSDRQADKVKLGVDNSTLANFDDPAWRKGAKIDVQWGYTGNMAPTRRAVIVSVKGFLTLTIEARAESVLMNRITRSRVFDNMTRSEVVRQIAEENGWSGDAVDIDDTAERLEHITQARLTDAQMIRRLSAREGMEFFVDVDGFHWHARRLAQRPIRTFRYFTDRRGEIIGEPSVDNDVTARPGRVRVCGRDPLTREDIDATADNESDADRPGLGFILDLIDFESGGTTEMLNVAQEDTRPTSAPTQGTAESEARARFRRAQQNAIKMKLPIVGDPGLLAKTVIQIEGMGRRLSVRYYIEEVRHIFGSGYRCDLKLISDGHGGHDTTSRVARGLDAIEVGPASRARQNTEDAPAEGAGGDRSGDDPGELHPVDVVNLETGATETGYRRTPPRGRNES